MDNDDSSSDLGGSPPCKRSKWSESSSNSSVDSLSYHEETDSIHYYESSESYIDPDPPDSQSSTLNSLEGSFFDNSDQSFNDSYGSYIDPDSPDSSSDADLIIDLRSNIPNNNATQPDSNLSTDNNASASSANTNANNENSSLSANHATSNIANESREVKDIWMPD